jgi:hypothetical protein
VVGSKEVSLSLIVSLSLSLSLMWVAAVVRRSRRSLAESAWRRDEAVGSARSRSTRCTRRAASEAFSRSPPRSAACVGASWAWLCCR